MKIDIFAHILPEKYYTALGAKVDLNNYNLTKCRAAKRRDVQDLEYRLKLMDRYPDVLQVITISLPPLDKIVSPQDQIELSKIANDELTEIQVKHPDKFIAGVASVPVDDMDAALKETDRAITQLGLKGIQLNARVNGEGLDDPKFKPLYEKMAKYDLPIWIHPCSDDKLDEPLFGWPFATTWAMRCLVTAGVFQDYPNIKFITHHCGAMVSFFADRIKWLYPLKFKLGEPARNWSEDFHKFYNDTATYGCTPSLMCGYDYFGADHLLFGTDAPLGPESGLTLETIDSIQRMNIPEGDKEKIFFRKRGETIKDSVISILSLLSLIIVFNN